MHITNYKHIKLQFSETNTNNLMLALPALQLCNSCFNREFQRGGFSPSDLSAVARSFNYCI